MWLLTDDGSEGQDSCVWLSSDMMSFASSSVDPCPAGSHLLTIKGSTPITGLLEFTSVMAGSVEFWVGGFQSHTAAYRNRDWTWVDGTSASNLNCGSPNALACALWSATVRY
jgi:hypothetical protein